MKNRFVFAASFFACSLALQNSTHADSNWPRWRGPDGNGISTEKGFPIEWTAKSVLWKTPLKGKGQSSPILWGDRIFLTSAEDGGKTRLVICIDRKTGSILWEQTAWKGTPEPSHAMNGWATPTCCTDGERVYAFFGMAGLHCYTVEGKHVWSKELGKFLSKTKRGVAASPVLAGDLVVQIGDSDSDPYMFGLDKRTGEIKWKTDRPKIEGYSTPILVDVDGHTELIVNGDPYVAGYSPKTGEKLWWCKSFVGRGEPTVMYADGLVHVLNGQPGDVYAVRPGGKGDVTKTHMAWHTPRKSGRDQPSPLVVNGFLFACNMEGWLNCYDAKSGKDLWKERVSMARTSAAPVAAEGRVYLLDEDGMTVVLEPGPKLKVLARNVIDPSPGELFRAVPTPSGGQFFLRSDRVLYCVGK
jgi:outer membrane protein assembly factor BamB